MLPSQERKPLLPFSINAAQEDYGTQSQNKDSKDKGKEKKHEYEQDEQDEQDDIECGKLFLAIEKPYIDQVLDPEIIQMIIERVFRAGAPIALSDRASVIQIKPFYRAFQSLSLSNIRFWNYSFYRSQIENRFDNDTYVTYVHTLNPTYAEIQNTYQEYNQLKVQYDSLKYLYQMLKNYPTLIFGLTIITGMAFGGFCMVVGALLGRILDAVDTSLSSSLSLLLGLGAGFVAGFPLSMFLTNYAIQRTRYLEEKGKILDKWLRYPSQLIPLEEELSKLKDDTMREKTLQAYLEAQVETELMGLQEKLENSFNTSQRYLENRIVEKFELLTAMLIQKELKKWILVIPNRIGFFSQMSEEERKIFIKQQFSTLQEKLSTIQKKLSKPEDQNSWQAKFDDAPILNELKKLLEQIIELLDSTEDAKQALSSIHGRIIEIQDILSSQEKLFNETNDNQVQIFCEASSSKGAEKETEQSGRTVDKVKETEQSGRIDNEIAESSSSKFRFSAS